MSSNQSPVLSIQRFVSFERDIAPVFKNAAIEESVKDCEMGFAIIDVGRCTRRLMTVGDLLAIAYAGSKGLNCNAQVVMLLADYQTLSKDSQIACGEFLMASMKALQYHNMALQMANSHQPAKALQALAMTSKVAANMTGIADKLVKKSEQMSSLATEALVVASQDNGVAAEKKKEIATMFSQLEVHKAELDSTIESLKANVIDAHEDEKKAAERADGARTMELVKMVADTVSTGFLAATKFNNVAALLGALYSIAEPETPEKETAKEVLLPPDAVTIASKKGDLAKALVNIENEASEAHRKELEAQVASLAAEIKSLELSRSESIDRFNAMREEMNRKAESDAEREARLHVDRLRLQELDRKANAELRGAIRRLNDTSKERDYIGQALTSLDIAIKAIGKIKTIFENTKGYWDRIKNGCDDLAGKSGDFEFAQESEEMLADAITKSWYSWLALSRINHEAVCAMEKVTAKVDNTMNDLPTTEEAQERLPDLIKILQSRQLARAEGLGIRGLQGLLLSPKHIPATGM